MYVRSTPGKRRKNGTRVEYVQLAHNNWDPVKQRSTVRVLHTFGRSDRLDVAGMRRLGESIARYLEGRPDTGQDADDTGRGLRLLASRPMGAAWLMDHLWTDLGIGPAIATAIGARRLDARTERVLFALVANRAINPASKRAALEWAAHDVLLPGIEDLGADPQVAYRAMDTLLEYDAAIQERVFFAVAGRLGLECDVLLFDTTSTYFEVDDDDGPAGFRRFGHSKDHRGDRPQAVIGLAVTKEGIPVRVWSWPGNTADASVIGQVHADLAAWGLHRVLWVGDRGFTSTDNRRLLQSGGGHVLFGEKLRGVTANEQALARPGRFSTVADNLQVKEVWVGDGVTRRRFIVVRNPDEATRDAATRARHLARIEAELTAIARKRGDARLAAEGELLAHPVLKRYLTRRHGTLVVNKAAVAAETRLDGKFLLSCTDDRVPAADAARLFKGLLDVERGFRDLKSVLEIRPVYHRKEERIRAHVTLCFLALVLIRVAETHTRDTWPTLARELDRIHAIDLAGSVGTMRQRTEITDDQQAILTACGVPTPPLILATQPATTQRRRARKTA